MSTRSTLTIKTPGGAQDFYRHHDGYREGAGEDLIKATRSWIVAGCPAIYPLDFIETYMKPYNDRYEKTDEAKLHVDTEYHYELDVTLGRVKVTMIPIKFGWTDNDEEILTIADRAIEYEVLLEQDIRYNSDNHTI